jgi:hypothetical protein
LSFCGCFLFVNLSWWSELLEGIWLEKISGLWQSFIFNFGSDDIILHAQLVKRNGCGPGDLALLPSDSICLLLVKSLWLLQLESLGVLLLRSCTKE